MRKKILPFIAAIIAIALLAGCSSANSSSKADVKPEEKISAGEIIVGTWYAEIDMSYLEERLFQNEKELNGYFIPESFTVPLVFEFSSDGGYTVSLKSEETKSQLTLLTEKIKNALKNYFTDAFSLENSADALDKFLREQKISIDDMTEDVLNKNAFVKTLYGVEYQGLYKIQNDKYFFGRDEAELDSLQKYAAFEIKGKTEISIVEIVEIGDEGIETLKKALPITIKKQ
ncbi:MAG: hypothetical protein IKZ59_07415 [Clostridia bacterium]|nr:hypothetical protein [Clostridia bacterium]